MKTLNNAVTLMLVAFVFTTLSCSNIDSPEKTVNNAHSETGVLDVAKQVVEAFKTQDGYKLALLAHPTKGVRFSSSAYVDVASDIVFSTAQIKTFWTDKSSYTWGFADGSGEPINLIPSQYCTKYIMNRDFLSPSSISINNDQAAGNTTNNAAEIYPNGTRVEYFIKPSTRDGAPELDWAALRLVFEKNGESWFLIAVIHDEWTI